ncbi:hypothetical protein P8891_06170 [Bacillus atrophaeus]|uniref:hypothetical protein n=1 Tax=Bacillus atrophaeus TaxID=1452 RepID=UPI00227F3A40|nr:hypothetical protein [Bacillus atrophaeus]MCY7948035.1 hypothetical protein [Bacillus atrophaeus]MCY8098020.1 hypothetical protein [Bacillus atrophaeus]MCY9169944.1 hypothetical protein [Bacillus atrophaeus]MEC0740669.1 hypothetical protein [Bacillus atrophaeus]MEC0747067.1 hypothetical protein [Bacillus atrophaeus]
MKVIKTNLSIVNDKIVDHQSYVEEEKDWDSFIKKVESGFLFSKTKKVEVKNIIHDDFHLSCDVYNSMGSLTKHLAYVDGQVVVNG